MSLTLENELYSLLNKKVINWEAVETILANNHQYINEFDEKFSQSLLAILLESCFYKRGESALKLTKLFLKHGFDVNANNTWNGSSCLHYLCWGIYDYHILDIAELLLDAGANTHNLMDDDTPEDEGVLDSISSKLGYWNLGAYEEANIFEAYYDMIEREQAGLSYKGIRAFRASVGDRVERVFLIKHNSLSKPNEIRSSMILATENRSLVISDYCDFIVSPYALGDAIEVIDITEQYNKIVGSRIRGLRFSDATTAKLSFDNGMFLGVTCQGEEWKLQLY